MSITTMTPAEFDFAAGKAEAFEAEFPNWADREDFGIRILTEADFGPEVHEADLVSQADWDFFIESTFVDMAERF